MGLTIKNLICRVRVTLPSELVGPGKPLDAALRSKMERLLGGRFDGVTVHADAEAAALARRLDADALIAGRHVYFGEGQFDPLTGRGIGLLAHELIHRQHETEGTDDVEAEREALRVERQVAASQGRPHEAVYLEGATEERVGDEGLESKPVEPARPQLTPPASPPDDLDGIVTAKVLALMRSELVLESERRGLISPSAGRIPL